MPSETDAPLRLLAIEDDPTDRSWLELMLKDASACPYTLRFVGTMNDAVAALGAAPYDCALLDLSLPDCDGLESVRRVLGAAPAMPIVVFTGRKDQQLGLQAIEAGAQDYLVKGQASGNTILQSARWAAARLTARSRLTSSDVPLVDRLAEAWVCVGPNLELDTVNPAFLDVVGFSEKEALGRPIQEFVAAEFSVALADSLARVRDIDGSQSAVLVVELVSSSGARTMRTVLATPTRHDGVLDGLFLLFGAPPPPPPAPPPPPPG